MSERAQKFLHAFASLEDVVRSNFDEAGPTAFRERVRKLADNNSMIRRYKSDIDLFTELRNVLVHRRFEEKYLAEPLPEITEELMRITEKLLRPPLMVNHFRVGMREFSKLDTMKTVYTYLHDKDFSQIFLRNEERELLCLSARTMQRWTASQGDVGLVDLSTTIHKVLEYSENLDEVSFVPRTATVVDAQQYFGNKVAPFQVAVIATETGKSTEKPLALITAWDLGQIERVMSGDQV